MIKSPLHIFGRNSNVTGSFGDLWAYSGLHTEITGATGVYISSSSSSDSSQEIKVEGLDGDYAIQTVTQALDGQTETRVGTSETWMRIFKTSNVGATGLAGDVYCYSDDTVSSGVPATAAKVQTKIPIGYGQSLAARWTVPTGSTAYLTSFYGFASTASGTEIDLMHKKYGDAVHVEGVIDINANGGKITLDHPIVCTEKSDIYLRAKAGGAVSGGIAGYYTT